MAEELEKKIISQLEYYFGDVNLPRDKFMNEQIKLDDGWIPLDILLTFKRLATLSSDAEVIAAAAVKSGGDIIEVSEDKKKIRRSPNNPAPELNEERRKEITSRTAYAKGFPLDEELDKIIQFVKTHGTIDSCSRRTYRDKATKENKFKGSCFIVFKNLEECKKFIETEELKYGETNLIRKWQADYFEEKKKEREEYKTKSGKNANKADKQNGDKKKYEFPKGAVLYFDGVSSESELSRENIKEKIKEVGDIEASFVDFSKGQTSGHIRLPGENSAVKFLEKLEEKKMKIGETTLDIRVLEGEEEEKFLEETAAQISKKRSFNKSRSGFGGGRNRKRRGNHRDDGPRSKK